MRAQRAIQRGEGLFAAGPGIGHFDDAQLRLDRLERAAADDPTLHSAELQPLDHVLFVAQLAAGKDFDPDPAFGLFGNLSGKALCGRVPAVGVGQHMTDADGGFGKRARRQTEGGGGDKSGQQAAADREDGIHGPLLSLCYATIETADVPPDK